MAWEKEYLDFYNDNWSHAKRGRASNFPECCIEDYSKWESLMAVPYYTSLFVMNKNGENFSDFGFVSYFPCCREKYPVLCSKTQKLIKEYQNLAKKVCPWIIKYLRADKTPVNYLIIKKSKDVFSISFTKSCTYHVKEDSVIIERVKNYLNCLKDEELRNNLLSKFK